MNANRSAIEEDKDTLQAYLDRLGDRPRKLITTVDDPDFGAKIEAEIRRQLQAGDASNGGGTAA